MKVEQGTFYYDAETLNILEQRVKEYEENGSNGMSVEESMEFIKRELLARSAYNVNFRFNSHSVYIKNPKG